MASLDTTVRVELRVRPNHQLTPAEVSCVLHRPRNVRLSRIERRWLRRTVLIASLPLMALASVAVLGGALVLELGRTAIGLTVGTVRTWRLPSGNAEDEMNPRCAGGVRELDRWPNCAVCGAFRCDPCAVNDPLVRMIHEATGG